MQLINYIDLFMGALINSMYYIIIMKKVFSVKLNKNKKIVYLALLLCTIFTTLINYYNNDTFKILFIIPIASIGAKYMIDQTLTKSFIMTCISFFYLFVSEIIAAIVISIFGLEAYLFNSSVFGSIIGNIVIIVFAIPLLQIKGIKNYFIKLLQWIEKKKGLSILIVFAVFVGIIAYKNSFNIKNVETLIINIILSGVFFIIIYLLFKEYGKTEEISQNYNMLLSYLETYEKELIEKRKLIHDYNNQLIIINGYVEPKNKKLCEYLSQIIEDQKAISDKDILKNIDKIPLGLRGLINYKLSSVQEKLKFEIEVAECIKKVVIPDNIIKDYLKVTGVLLDNAIEASISSNRKDLKIELSIANRTLVLKICNSFDSKPDEKLIYNSGYTTKGSKRGYGLSLVKDIVSKNDKIKIAINIEDNQFIAIQTLDI